MVLLQEQHNILLDMKTNPRLVIQELKGAVATISRECGNWVSSVFFFFLASMTSKSKG